MGRRGYYPNQLGFHVSPSIDFPVEVKRWGFTWRHQFDRAERAIDRFKSFENVQADDEAVFELVDEFFEAALTVSHCWDAVEKILEDGRDDKALQAFMDQDDQRVLRDIANASKHSGLDHPAKFSDGEITLDLMGGHQSPTDMLSDVYRRLQLRVAGKSPEHPSDFLTRVMNQWNKFALDNLVGEELAKKLDAS